MMIDGCVEALRLPVDNLDSADYATPHRLNRDVAFLMKILQEFIGRF